MKRRLTHNPDLPFIKNGWEGNPINSKNQYINLDGPGERSFKELYKWQWETNPLKALKRKQQSTVAVEKNTSFIRCRTDGITWIGHATFFITLAGKQIITDPVFGNVGPVKRYTPLPCKADELKGVDYILLSHNHRDHAEKKSLQQLCALNPKAIVLTGLEIGKLLRSWKIANTIIEAGWYQQYVADEKINFTYLPAKHWNRRGLKDMNEMLWGSFMIESKESTIYFGADSGLGIHFEEIAGMFPAIDYALLGIGAYKPEWFMHTAHTGPADALLAFEKLKAKYFIPMHHGTFDLSDEPIFYPKQELTELAAKEKLNNILHLDIGTKQLF
jgi:L-ascorbate metabolism protein UlaG (beta-lactamase superfamily)